MEGSEDASGPPEEEIETIRSSSERASQTGSEARAGSHGQHVEWRQLHEMYKRRHSSALNSGQRRPSLMVSRDPKRGSKHWKFTLRTWDDGEPEDWWFASTAVPLLAATIGPLANVMSIAALVTEWRECLIKDVTKADAARCLWDGQASSLGTQIEAVSFHDPRWCFWLNVVSLIVGFVGNFFLLCNFTNRVRYIIALPMSIVMWTLATSILMGIVSAVAVYAPPIQPQQTFTQGYWYAVIASTLYMICSVLLMGNMLGYFLGHYPQHFNLTDSQRTLILQSTLFIVWLGGGAGVFSAVEHRYGTGGQVWSYVDAIYYCDVTIITVGFGDLYPTNNVSRGLAFPYAIGGIIMLGLVVSSISKFATELSSENIIQRYTERHRSRTIDRANNATLEHQKRETLHDDRNTKPSPACQDSQTRNQTVKFADEKETPRQSVEKSSTPTLRKIAIGLTKVPSRQRKSKLVLLKEERDRFDAMRHIQRKTANIKKWYSLSLSLTAFSLLWCVGAAIFWLCERQVRSITYFDALYFCYVALLTIGYGDFAPQSNAGRPFFVLWSLVAVPTMTILISHLGDTLIHHFKHGAVKLADFTVLPKYGAWRQVLDQHFPILEWTDQWKQRRSVRRRLEEGFQPGPDRGARASPPALEELAEEEELSRHELARRLATKIRQTADDVRTDPDKRYSYEEWVEITQLIRFTAKGSGGDDDDDGIAPFSNEGDELIEWDWIGADSPMMSRKSEADFVLDRLCESMHRYIKEMAQILPREFLDAPAKDLVDDAEENKLTKRQTNQHAEDEYKPFNPNFSFG